MKEYLNYINKNRTWELISIMKENNVIKTKWVFGNKLDQNENVVRNVARIFMKMLFPY